MQKISAYERVLNEINSADNLLSENPKNLKIDFVGDIDRYEEGRFDIYVSQGTAIGIDNITEKIEIPFTEIAEEYGKDYALDMACKNIYDVNYDNHDVYVRYNANVANGRTISLRNMLHCLIEKTNPYNFCNDEIAMVR